MKRTLLVIVSLATACAAHREARTQRTLSALMDCDVSQIGPVTEVNGGYVATACGRHMFCSDVDGPCQERLSTNDKAERARAAFARTTGCSAATVTPAFTGWIVQGCSLYYQCASYDGPCYPARPLTCREMAQHHFDTCLASARGEGRSGRNVWWVGDPRPAIVGSIGATVMENQVMEQCKSKLNTEIESCDLRSAARANASSGL